MVNMIKYYIRERWNVSGYIEKYDEKTNPVGNSKRNLKEVKKFIEDWIETWKENAEENGYEFLGFKTDYRTFARLRIKTGTVGNYTFIDRFSLKVVRA